MEPHRSPGADAVFRRATAVHVDREIVIAARNVLERSSRPAVCRVFGPSLRAQRVRGRGVRGLMIRAATW
jgi:hypothetical protein